MKVHGSVRTRVSAVVLGIVVLVAAHTLALTYASSRVAVSAAVLSGLIVLVVVMHLGVLGAARARLRRPSGRTSPRR